MGKTNVSHSDLQSFMEIAESLQIKGLSTSNKKIKEVINANDSKDNCKRSLNSQNSLEEPNKKEIKLDDSTDLTIDDDEDDDCETTTSTNDIDLIPIPEVSMTESRFESSKSDIVQSSLKISNTQSLNTDSYDLSIMNERAHTENPSCSNSNITMLSSTSLLHGNCIFNRNNTVATQQGLKTYWYAMKHKFLTIFKFNVINFF